MDGGALAQAFFHLHGWVIKPIQVNVSGHQAKGASKLAGALQWGLDVTLDRIIHMH